MNLDFHIGIDIGGTHIRSALVDGEGIIHGRCRTLSKTFSDPRLTIQDLAHDCAALIQSAGDLGGTVRGVGLGVAGRIDAAAGLVVFSPNLPHTNGYPLAKELARLLQLPVFMENDANVFGIGEAWRGAGRGIDNWVGVTLGTGVGGCFIFNGRLWQGDGLGFAGEVGHTIVQPDGLPCACGMLGCLEAYASAGGLIRSVEAFAVNNDLPPGPLLEHWKKKTLDAHAIFQCAEDGDPAAIQLFDRMGWALGIALANLFTALGIRTAVIGGGVSASWSQFIKPLLESLRTHTRMFPAEEARILQSELGDDAALLGAAKLAE